MTREEAYKGGQKLQTYKVSHDGPDVVSTWEIWHVFDVCDRHVLDFGVSPLGFLRKSLWGFLEEQIQLALALHFFPPGPLPVLFLGPGCGTCICRGPALGWGFPGWSC